MDSVAPNSSGLAHRSIWNEPVTGANQPNETSTPSPLHRSYSSVSPAVVPDATLGPSAEPRSMSAHATPTTVASPSGTASLPSTESNAIRPQPTKIIAVSRTIQSRHRDDDLASHAAIEQRTYRLPSLLERKRVRDMRPDLIVAQKSEQRRNIRRGTTRLAAREVTPEHADDRGTLEQCEIGRQLRNLAGR